MILSKINLLDVFKAHIKKAKRIGGSNPRVNIKSDDTMVSLFAEKAILKMQMHRYYREDSEWEIGPSRAYEMGRKSEHRMQSDMMSLQYRITQEEDRLFAQLEHTYNNLTL